MPAASSGVGTSTTFTTAALPSNSQAWSRVMPLQPLRTVTVAIGDHEMLVEPPIPDAARAVIDAINAE